MNPKEHARAARRLIAECGGLDECVRILRDAGRLKGGRTLLSNYQTGREGATMSAEIMDLLQADCGKPLYSDRLSAERKAPVVGRLDDAVCDVSQEALAMQGRAREALADGELTPRELDQLAIEEGRLSEALETVRATLRGAEAGLGRKRSLKLA